MPDVTQILSQIEAGDLAASDQLLPLVYDELRKLAAAKLSHEKPGQTLQATALVHEAYLRLLSPDHGSKWNSAGHFFAAAAEAMRRILIETARHKRSQKAGGAWRRHPLDIALTLDSPPDELLMLDDALTKLARVNADASKLAQLRLFAGLTVDQAGDCMNISRSSGFRLWTYARAFLQAEFSATDR